MSKSIRIGGALGAGLLLLGTAACGGDPAPAAAGTTDQQPTTQAGPAFPGAQGEVAALDGSTAQVQSPMSGQVAVTWNGSTTFTKQVSAALSDVEVGACVMVRSDEADGRSDEVAAASVRITRPVDGSCQPAGFGRRGGDGGGFQGPPPGAEGGKRPRMTRMGGAFGQVTAVASSGFTVRGGLPGGSDAADQSVKVVVSQGTTYTTDATAKAADVRVGSCVVARGKADDTGAIAATSVAISAKQDGSCQGGLVVRGGPGGAPATQES